MTPAERPPPADRQNPGLETGIVTEVRQLSKREHECLLHHIFCIRGTAERGECSTIHGWPVPEDELAEGCRVPAEGPLDELVVGQIRCRASLGEYGWHLAGRHEHQAPNSNPESKTSSCWVFGFCHWRCDLL